jgi:hypothetical protein
MGYNSTTPTYCSFGEILVMKKIVPSVVHAMLIASLLHTAAHAVPGSAPTPQMRTYVSGLGTDNNPCTALLPCKSFQAALALTLAGGEIYVLNSADYGAVTINKAVTITSEGATAGILATSGNGITISAGPSDVINLRGLDIDGGRSGGIGIQFSSGQSLNIQKSVVRNFTSSGINFAPSGTGTLFVSDTVVLNNGANGIIVGNGSSTVNGALSRVIASGNGVGLSAYGNAVNMIITDAVAGNNNYGIAANSSAIMVRNSTVSNNAVGIAADQAAIIRVGQSTVTANGTGWRATNAGQVQSYGNNNVSGNTADGILTSTIVLQ